MRLGFLGGDIISQPNPALSYDDDSLDLLSKIYDTVTIADPSDYSHDMPWLATNWTIGEWTYNGMLATTLELKLREDVYWQDIPPKADRTTPNGKSLLPGGASNIRFSADDLIFSINMVKSLTSSVSPYISDVVYAEKKDPSTVKLFYDTYMPLWALHWLSNMLVVPKHVWAPVLEEGTLSQFDPIVEQCLSGTGAWYYDYAASSMHNYYMLRANTRFFRYHPLDVTGEPVDSYEVVPPCTNVTINFYWHWTDAQRPTLSAGEFTLPLWALTPTDTDIELPDNSHVLIPAWTWTKIWEVPNPTLSYSQNLLAFAIKLHVTGGPYIFEANITPDPLTGHTDEDGYQAFLRCTIREDTNLDYYVNAKDAVKLGAAFGWSWI